MKAHRTVHLVELRVGARAYDVFVADGGFFALTLYDVTRGRESVIHEMTCIKNSE